MLLTLLVILTLDQLCWHSVTQLDGRAVVHDDVTGIVRHLESFCQTGDHVVVMSNKGFDGIHQRLLDSFSVVEC